MEEGSLRCDANVSLRPAGAEELGHEDRAQEHEQLPLPRARDRRPSSSARRELLEARRAGRAGDASLRPADRRADAAALEGVRARLPLLPRARPGAAGADRGDAARRPARRCPSCPPSARERYQAELGLPEATGDASSPSTPSSATTSSALLDAAPASVEPRRAIANWVTGELAARLREAGDAEATRPLEGLARRARRAGRDGRGEAGLDRRRAPGAGDAGRRGRRPGRDRRARGPRRRSRTRASSRRSSSARSRPSPRRPRRSAPAT